jgi:Ca2+-binding RTX toxin-like protein
VVSGNPSSVTHTYADGDANYTISATATDEDGTYAAGNTVAVTVNNVAPTADAGGPYFAFEDTPIVLNGSGSDPAGAADPLTFQWDLDGDNIFGETGAGATRGDEVGANPTFNPNGLGTTTWTVKLIANDGDGGTSSVATATVQVLGQGSVVVGGVLHIVGTNGCDIVLISQCNDQIVVIATFNQNNPMYFDADDVTAINVRVRNSSDIVITTPSVMEEMTIDGGSGNDLLTGGGSSNLIIGGTGHDVLVGGGSDDVLLGGDGNDDLFGNGGNDALVGGNGRDILNGGAGRDLLIGSQDEDRLVGGNDEDILIGGYTVHDNNVAALDAVMAVWTSSASFNDRVATLTGSGGLLQANVAVFDDNDEDTIIGGAGRDLIFGDVSTMGDGVKDSIALQSMLDALVAVN